MNRQQAARKIIVMQRPGHYVVIIRDREAKRFLAYVRRYSPYANNIAGADGAEGHAHRRLKAAASDIRAHRYPTVLDALNDHPQAVYTPRYDLGRKDWALLPERAPAYDPEGGA